MWRSVRTSSGSWYMRRETQEIANIEARIARYTGIPVQHGEGLQVRPTRLGAYCCLSRGRGLLACRASPLPSLSPSLALHKSTMSRVGGTSPVKSWLTAHALAADCIPYCKWM